VNFHALIADIWKMQIFRLHGCLVWLAVVFQFHLCVKHLAVSVIPVTLFTVVLVKVT